MRLTAHRSDLRGVLNKKGTKGCLCFSKGLKSNIRKEVKQLRE